MNRGRIIHLKIQVGTILQWAQGSHCVAAQEMSNHTTLWFIGGSNWLHCWQSRPRYLMLDEQEHITFHGDGMLNELTFAVALGQVEKVVNDELLRLSKEGFSDSAVQAALNTIEFSLRENNTGSFPRGLALMFAAVNAWIYDREPIENIKVEQTKKQ